MSVNVLDRAIDVVSIDILKGLIKAAPIGKKTDVAIAHGRTVFPNTIIDVADGLGKTENVFKKGNSKLSKKVSRGVWHGNIYALTLEERATCSNTCNHWADCYGNHMHNARRYILNDAMIARMEFELSAIQAKLDQTNAKLLASGMEPDVFVVRLHVLGDFASVAYVEQWRTWLEMFPSLRVWGYTHWHVGTDIGDSLLKLRNDFGGIDARQGARFCIRYSDDDSHGPSALSADNPMANVQIALGNAFTCPEQKQSKEQAESDKAIHCGNCGLCWSSAKHVVFITH